MDNPLGVLGTSVARLRELVGGLDVAELEKPSYCAGWDVAAVLAHLGSGGVIMERRLEDARVGGEMPEDFAPRVWDEWNAKSPRAQADDSLAVDQRLLEALESVSASERTGMTFAFGPITLGFDEAVAARLNEHAFHTWDIEVAFRGNARIPADSVALIIDNLGLIARFSAKPTGDEREVRVRTSDPVRHFTVRLTADAAELLAGDAGMAPDMELPAESLCRLIYGRLDPDHSPMVSANGEVLDLLRRVFPGP